METSKKSFRILSYGLISQVVTLVLGIVMPKLFIVNYGSEVNGLLSSIQQIFVYVALLEAGVGLASVQALYGPINRKDYVECSEILAATDHYYKRTGVMYAVAVVIIAIVYPYVIKNNIDNFVVSAIILLQGGSGVINYFVQGKYAILLRVDGRTYVTTNVSMVLSIISKIVQIGLILLGFDILIVQVAYFLVNLGQMIYITWYVNKNYPWLNLKCKPKYVALNQSKNVMVHQISRLVFNNTDVLVLSCFCGLKVVSVYALYNLVIVSVSNVIDTAGTSVEFVLGQKFNTNKDEFNSLFNTYETYYYGICFALFTITLIMLPSFINLYSVGITDINYVDKYLPYLFVILSLFNYARRPNNQVITFAGHFKQTQYRSILESVINLVVSVVLVYKIGIYGVIIGTIVALLYRTNDIIIYTSKHILNRSCLITYRRLLQNVVVMVCIVFGVNRILPPIDNYLVWIGNAIWVALLSFGAYLIVDSIFDKKSFNMAKNMIKYYLSKILHREIKH